MLATGLTENSYTVVHASDDANVKIAADNAKSKKVTVFGEDTDLVL